MSDMRRGTRIKEGTVRFSYDGREYLGQPGDTAASALLAGGVRYFGRSVRHFTKPLHVQVGLGSCRC